MWLFKAIIEALSWFLICSCISAKISNTTRTIEVRRESSRSVNELDLGPESNCN